MACLPKIYRPPASDLEPTIKKVRELVAPNLEDLLDTTNAGEIRVTTTIQDGVAQHHAVEVETVNDLMDKVDWPEPTKVLPLRAAEAMASGIRELKPRLLLSLVPGYHGFTLLRFTTRGKELHSVICVCRQVHKVQSARVPI